MKFDFDPHKGYPVRLAGQGLIFLLALVHGYSVFHSLCLGLGIESYLWSHYDLISILRQYIADLIRPTPLTGNSPESQSNLKKEEKAALPSPNDMYNGTAPPVARPRKLEQWQMRWNSDWYNDAVPGQMRKLYTYFMRYPVSKHTKQNLRLWSAEQEARTLDAIKKGHISQASKLSRSRWQRARDRVLELGPMKPLGCLKQGYDHFKEWRQDAKNKEGVWRVTAVMGDIRDKPRWEAELTFKIPAEEISRLRNCGKWFEFPSAENIKWWRVTHPNGPESLAAPSVRHWGPDIGGPTCWALPFGFVPGRVKRHPGEEEIDPMKRRAFITMPRSARGDSHQVGSRKGRK